MDAVVGDISGIYPGNSTCMKCNLMELVVNLMVFKLIDLNKGLLIYFEYIDYDVVFFTVLGKDSGIIENN